MYGPLLILVVSLLDGFFISIVTVIVGEAIFYVSFVLFEGHYFLHISSMLGIDVYFFYTPL